MGNLTEEIFLLLLREMGEAVLPVSDLDLLFQRDHQKSFQTWLTCSSMFSSFQFHYHCRCNLITDDCDRCENNVNKCYFSYLCLLALLCYYHSVLGYLNMDCTAVYAHWAP